MKHNGQRKRIHSNDLRRHGCLGCIDETLSAQVICGDGQILIDVSDRLPMNHSKSHPLTHMSCLIMLKTAQEAFLTCRPVCIHWWWRWGESSAWQARQHSSTVQQQWSPTHTHTQMRFPQHKPSLRFNHCLMYCQTCGGCRGRPARPTVYDRQFLCPVSIATHWHNPDGWHYYRKSFYIRDTHLK